MVIGGVSFSFSFWFMINQRTLQHYWDFLSPSLFISVLFSISISYFLFPLFSLILFLGCPRSLFFSVLVFTTNDNVEKSAIFIRWETWEDAPGDRKSVV